MDPRALDRQIAEHDPYERIRELEHENRVLRRLLEQQAGQVAHRELAGDVDVVNLRRALA